MDNERLHYGDKIIYMEGVIVAVDDCSISVDLKGRLGQLRIPKRMIISDYDLEVGQEVGFLMSYPEVFEQEPNDKYVRAIRNQQRLMRERKKDI